MTICPEFPALCYFIRLVLLAFGLFLILASIVMAAYPHAGKRRVPNWMPVLSAGLFLMGALFAVVAFYLAPHLLSLLICGDFSCAGSLCRPCGFDPWPFPR